MIHRRDWFFRSLYAEIIHIRRLFPLPIGALIIEYVVSQSAKKAKRCQFLRTMKILPSGIGFTVVCFHEWINPGIFISVLLLILAQANIYSIPYVCVIVKYSVHYFEGVNSIRLDFSVLM